MKSSNSIDKKSHDESHDEALVLRSQLGDRLALGELITRWHDPVWGFLRHVTLDDTVADDLAQETWLAVVRGLARLRQTDRFKPWLFTIARRTAADRLRRQYRRHELLQPQEQLEETATADPADLEVDRQYVAALIGGLDLQLREPVSLHYLLDCSVDEIAHILGIPAGTVKSRLYRARKQMLSNTRNPKANRKDHQ